ncbi:hypothetical protein L1987_76317 [Smallanthus sonchifolius]|uniref:Uncharacterized protein n=1 Tax=Smallanthus sonchifolius TaxID=185202 RepID=A0ACB9A781_9ASTR|nr:hypothetical protein L1987_76317 [Smallanthus sonchifolius]
MLCERHDGIRTIADSCSVLSERLFINERDESASSSSDESEERRRCGASAVGLREKEKGKLGESSFLSPEALLSFSSSQCTCILSFSSS